MMPEGFLVHLLWQCVRERIAVYCSVLHCVTECECDTVRVSALQCVIVRCSVFQCVAVLCCVAVCCNVLQYVAVC